MDNSEIAKILYDLSVLLDMKEVAFKPRAFEKASQDIGVLQESVADIYKHGGLKALENIPGVGRGIAERIEEYIKTGHIKDFDRLRKQIPVDIDGLSAIQGVGPKLILKLYKELGIRNRDQLEKAARAKKLENIAGMGFKTEQNILRNIEFLKTGHGRFLLGDILPVARRMLEQIRGVPGVRRAEFAGSIRRMQETVGDLDILAISEHPAKVMDFFVSLPEVRAVYGRGATKTSVRLKMGIDADVRVLSPESYGAALQYFTGDKYHNVQLRQIAIKKGYKLNEYGLWRGKKLVGGKIEEEIYEKLGFTWMPPELRTNNGELEAALRQAQGKPGGLPDLIGYDDIKGDLHMHSDWSDGQNTIEEMAKAAKALGREYISISDHTDSLTVAQGNDEAELLKEMAEIDRVQKRVTGIRILKGAEVDILKDGTLDLPDRILAKLDVVGVSVHSHFRLTEKEQTARIIRAMENPNVDIVCHPTGRLIGQREGYAVDVQELLKAAKRTGTVMEIDSFPDRLDLKDEYIRKGIEMGVKFSIDSDAHAPKHFENLEYGIAQARRGWAEKKDVINTRSCEAMLKTLK